MNEPVVAFLRYFLSVGTIFASDAYIGYASGFSDAWILTTAISFFAVFILSCGISSAYVAGKERISIERVWTNLFSYMSGVCLAVMGFVFLSLGEAFMLLSVMLLLIVIVPCAYPIKDPRLKKYASYFDPHL